MKKRYFVTEQPIRVYNDSKVIRPYTVAWFETMEEAEEYAKERNERRGKASTLKRISGTEDEQSEHIRYYVYVAKESKSRS